MSSYADEKAILATKYLATAKYDVHYFKGPAIASPTPFESDIVYQYVTSNRRQWKSRLIGRISAIEHEQVKHLIESVKATTDYLIDIITTYHSSNRPREVRDRPHFHRSISTGCDNNRRRVARWATPWIARRQLVLRPRRTALDYYNKGR